MATAKDIAVTVGQFADELATRLDLMLAKKEITPSGVASLSGMLEWAGSIQTALEECDGVPTPTLAEQCAAFEKARRS